MTEPDSMHERRLARRMRLGKAASWVSFHSVLVSFLASAHQLLVELKRLTGVLQLLAVVAVLVVAGCAATLVGTAIGLLVEKCHRTLWPEHPEGHE
jgi:hypothetical protein